MKSFDKKNIQALLIAETIVHEAVHSTGNVIDGFPGEEEAVAIEREFLKKAIEGLNEKRRSDDTHDLPLDLK